MILWQRTTKRSILKDVVLAMSSLIDLNRQMEFVQCQNAAIRKLVTEFLIAPIMLGG